MNAPLDPYILQQAACRASLLVATAGFCPDDWHDLRQELVLDCLRRSRKFDPARGDWQGFVRGIVRNCSSVLVTRQRRRAQWEVLAGDLPYKATRVESDPIDILNDIPSQDSENALQMSIDVRRVLDGLPLRLQTLALLLSELPVREVCAQTGKSRTRIYQLTLQLRTAFIEAGFHRRRPQKARATTKNKPRPHQAPTIDGSRPERETHSRGRHGPH